MSPAHAKAQDILDMRMCQTLPDNLRDKAVFSGCKTQREVRMLEEVKASACAEQQRRFKSTRSPDPSLGAGQQHAEMS